MPAAIPVTTPVVPSIVALGVVLVQAPPRVASNRVVVAPSHNTSVPPIAAGVEPTVITIVVAQPTAVVYVLRAVPIATAVATPLVPSIVTTPSLLLQLPPVMSSLRLSVPPTHTGPLPVIASGMGLTVIVVVVKQPLVNA